jgi:propionate CoA-transferase
VLYVTERAVFELRDGGVALIETAPGIDLEREVLGLMNFRPALGSGVKQMDARIFRPAPMGLNRDG